MVDNILLRKVLQDGFNIKYLVSVEQLSRFWWVSNRKLNTQWNRWSLSQSRSQYDPGTSGSSERTIFSENASTELDRMSIGILSKISMIILAMKELQVTLYSGNSIIFCTLNLTIAAGNPVLWQLCD